MKIKFNLCGIAMRTKHKNANYTKSKDLDFKEVAPLIYIAYNCLHHPKNALQNPNLVWVLIRVREAWMEQLVVAPRECMSGCDTFAKEKYHNYGPCDYEH